MRRSNRRYYSSWKLYSERPGRLEFRAFALCIGWLLLPVVAIGVSKAWPWTILSGDYQVGVNTLIGAVSLSTAEDLAFREVNTARLSNFWTEC